MALKVRSKNYPETEAKMLQDKTNINEGGGFRNNWGSRILEQLKGVTIIKMACNTCMDHNSSTVGVKNGCRCEMWLKYKLM